MDILRQKNIQFLQPFLPLNDKKSMIKRLQEQLPFTDISKKELANAVEKAYAELEPL